MSAPVKSGPFDLTYSSIDVDKDTSGVCLDNVRQDTPFSGTFGQAPGFNINFGLGGGDQLFDVTAWDKLNADSVSGWGEFGGDGIFTAASKQAYPACFDFNFKAGEHAKWNYDGAATCGIPNQGQVKFTSAETVDVPEVTL